MAVNTLQPDRAVGNDHIQFSGGRETAQLPALLIPAPANDPSAIGVGARIGRDFRLCLGKAGRVAEVERQSLNAQPHDMAMRVDQPRHEGAALPIQPEAIGNRRRLTIGLARLG